MASNRMGRINEEIQRELSDLIRTVKDPRVHGLISITRVDTTNDLKTAKIYVSVLEEDKREPMMAALKSAAGFIRRELGRNIIIRYSPELSFVSDRMDAMALGAALADRDVAVRSGLHCAPLAHQTAGTIETGTVRVSFSAFNTEEEVFRFLETLADILQGKS